MKDVGVVRNEITPIFLRNCLQFNFFINEIEKSQKK